MNPQIFDFNTPIEVRFADLDAYGHVNNTIFFTYLETARVKLFKQRFGPFLESEILFIVIRSECDYIAPIELDDPLEISVAEEQITFTSFTLPTIFTMVPEKSTQKPKPLSSVMIQK